MQWIIKWKKIPCISSRQEIKRTKTEIKKGERITPHFIDCSSETTKTLKFHDVTIGKAYCGRPVALVNHFDCAVFASTDFKWGKYDVALFVTFEYAQKHAAHTTIKPFKMVSIKSLKLFPIRHKERCYVLQSISSSWRNKPMKSRHHITLSWVRNGSTSYNWDLKCFAKAISEVIRLNWSNIPPYGLTLLTKFWSVIFYHHDHIWR